MNIKQFMAITHVRTYAAALEADDTAASCTSPVKAAHHTHESINALRRRGAAAMIRPGPGASTLTLGRGVPVAGRCGTPSVLLGTQAAAGLGGSRLGQPALARSLGVLFLPIGMHRPMIKRDGPSAPWSSSLSLLYPWK